MLGVSLLFCKCKSTKTHLAQNELHITELTVLKQLSIVLVKGTLWVAGKLQQQSSLVKSSTCLKITRVQNAGQLNNSHGLTLTWNLYISPLRTLLSTVPPKLYMASWITAAAWNSLPLGI